MSVKKCERCGTTLYGAYTFKTCRNTEACKRRAEKLVKETKPVTLEITVLSLTEYELSNKASGVDAHLRYENGAWVLDEFDMKNPDAKGAHIESQTINYGDGGPNWTDVIKAML